MAKPPYDDNAPIHRAGVVTGWFDEYEYDVNHMPSQSPDLNPINLKSLWVILEWCLRQRFQPPSTKHQIMEFLVEQWCCIPPIDFQTLVESMPRCIEAILVRGDQCPIYCIYTM